MKIIGRVMQPFSAYHLMTLYICTKFQENNISMDFRVIEPILLKFTKGCNSITKHKWSYGTCSVHIA